MLKALDPFYPCLLVLRAIGFFYCSFFFFLFFFSQASFFTAFSYFKNQFHDFSDHQ
ncbi:uncharacterized protein DS421_7g212950 [Arachis hypogaea]|nr:uncharacterized protein DS421_7g212950 [Arachis hypogaea]